MMPENAIVAILPTADMDAAEAFFARLGFQTAGYHDAQYRILSNGVGAHLHLNRMQTGWLQGHMNPLGLYLYAPNVKELAERFRGETIEPGGAEAKPWGTFEFSLNGPDCTLVRVGRAIS